MSREARDCFILAGVATAGVVVGAIIGVVPAAVIGREIARNGGVACSRRSPPEGG